MTTILVNYVEFYCNLDTQISYFYASDYILFENNGEITRGLYETNKTPHGHTATDLLANINPTYLTEVTKRSLYYCH